MIRKKNRGLLSCVRQCLAPDDFIVMAVDGASSHKSKDLKTPENVALARLPPYSPELNPAEQIWNSLRKNYFANKVFDSLDAATEQTERGLSGINLIANYNHT
jgi:transposase